MGLGLTKDDVTVMSLDIKNMYPLVRVKLIKRALEFYSQNLSREEKQKIQLGIKMVQFGMKNTLVSYQDKYFVYKGAAKGANLTIGNLALAIGSVSPEVEQKENCTMVGGFSISDK
eukprot:3511347-Ditylum_brightwellii.AAC.1